MRTYIDASAALAKCLTRQVELGVRIVAAAEALMCDQSAAEMQQCMLSISRLRKKARLGNAELKKLRTVVKRAKSRLAFSAPRTAL